MTYELKAWPQYFGLLLSGENNFEVKKEDHDFKVGDILVLREYDPATEMYTGWQTSRKVSYIFSGGQFGIDKDYCVMSLTEFNNQKAAI